MLRVYTLKDKTMDGPVKNLCATMVIRGEIVLNCGYCGVGNVLPQMQHKCKVCKAVVVEVHETDEMEKP